MSQLFSGKDIEIASRTARCEAFHFAPRLFFMFLSLIPFTILQQYIIYPPRNFPLYPNRPLVSHNDRLVEGNRRRLGEQC